MATSNSATAPAIPSMGGSMFDFSAFGGGPAAATVAAAAQPTINAIQQQITALLPSDLASAITSQFAGGSSMQPAMSGAAPTMTFSYPADGSAVSSAMAASLAQPTIAAIMQEITAILPSDLASAITSQFAGASTSPDQGSMLMQPSIGSAASMPLLGDQLNAFLSIPQTT